MMNKLDEIGKEAIRIHEAQKSNKYFMIPGQHTSTMITADERGFPVLILQPVKKYVDDALNNPCRIEGKEAILALYEFLKSHCEENE